MTTDLHGFVVVDVPNRFRQVLVRGDTDFTQTAGLPQVGVKPSARADDSARPAPRDIGEGSVTL
jgi:hypothetical protein